MTLLRAGSALIRSRTAVVLGVMLLIPACAQVPSAPQAMPETPQDPPLQALAPSPAALPDPVPAAEPPAPKVIEPAVVIRADAPPPSLWTRIRKRFAMRNLENPLVREWEQWYSSRPDYVARMVERSSRVLFHVVEEVERRRLPAEIVLLPMIESAYNPQAYSRAHASGMWQFIPSTGKLYGLQQNWWYDGRRDIVAATNAALDYLEKLYGMFGDWELALASYNWGEGAVSRAMARNQARGLPADYENLSMPNETRNYLPKLQAVKNIIADPGRFGLALADIANESYFATLTTPHHIDIELAARFAEISVEEFRFLNPAHNKPVINANAAETIVLPKNKIETFQRNLDSHRMPLVSWQAYTVKPGEQIEKIAARHGMSVAELKQVNNISGRTKLRTGQPLLVPVRAGATPHLPDLPASPVARAPAVKARHVSNTKRGAATTKTVQTRATAPKSTKETKGTRAAKSAAPTKRVKASSPAKPAAPPRQRVELADNR